MLALIAAALVAPLLLAAAPARAHDIPAAIVVHAFFSAEGPSLEAVVRVPLKSLPDVDLPRRGPGYLDLPQAEPALREAALRWLVGAFEVRRDGQPLPPPAVVAVRASLESERPFASFAAARAHVTGAPLPPATEVPAEQVMVDALLRWALPAPGGALALAPHVDRFGLRVTTALRFEGPDGVTRAFEFHGDPGTIALDPGAFDVARRFVVEGIGHVLTGADHLLFVLCLVIPLTRFRPLALVVTAFTLGHSLTLIGAAFLLPRAPPWFAPAVETLIAVSILWLALQNILGPGALRPRYAAAFGFGLIHGFGFAFALSETLQFAGDHLLEALVAFNVGVELGQLAALLVFVPVLALLFRALPAPAGRIVLSALVAHVAWHWMIERGAALEPFAGPAFDAVRGHEEAAFAAAAAVVALLWWAARRGAGGDA